MKQKQKSFIISKRAGRIVFVDIINGLWIDQATSPSRQNLI